MLLKKSLIAASVLALAVSGCSSLKSKPAETKQATSTTATEQAKPAAVDTNASVPATPSADELAAKAAAEKAAAEKAAADKAAAEKAAMEQRSAQEAAAAKHGKQQELSTRVVYFDFDTSTLKQDFLSGLKAHAKYLAAHPNAKVKLAGHCDERGTSEYNMALGERRAKSVASFLKAEGVKSSQLELISYGKEKPADPGHDEAAWAKNRRVEISYLVGEP